MKESTYVADGRSSIHSLSRYTAVAKTVFGFSVVECGSLALSILREDEMAVSQTLESYPYTSKEANSLGQTPCHVAVAVGNLRILELVLLYTSRDVLNTPDNSGHYPIDYALSRYNHQYCHKSQDPSACKGCKVLEMVLNSNCALYLHTLRYTLLKERLAKATKK
ncbi:hypothetical protein LY78DRAFT_594435 [Colletotrichum sublineola]|nr:hypothetical protein LY78DRAFT_594435 [Colletotrichum sublineola]